MPINLEANKGTLKKLLTASTVVFQNPPSKMYSEYETLKAIGIKRQRRKKGICLSESGLYALEELVSVSCGECYLLLVPVFPKASKLLIARVLKTG